MQMELRRHLIFIHAAAAEVQGAVMAEAEAIMGLHRGTTVTRAQSQTAAVGPTGARLLDIRVPRARGLLSDQWIRGYHDPSAAVRLWPRTIGKRRCPVLSPPSS